MLLVRGRDIIMLARFSMIFSAVFVLAACSTATSDNGSLDIGSPDGMNGGVIVGNGGALSAEDVGPAPGTQADLVVNVGDRVFFETDSSDLIPSARSMLESQSAWLGQYMLNVIVEGHADERGTREYNLALGERRAMAVKNYLVALGVSSSRISTVTYGKERPAVLGADKSAWLQNRRVVTTVR